MTPSEFRADLRCESDALRLAPDSDGPRVEREVAESHAVRNRGARDFLQQLDGDLLAALRDGGRRRTPRIIDGERRDLDEGAVRDAHARSRRQPCAAAVEQALSARNCAYQRFALSECFESGASARQTPPIPPRSPRRLLPAHVTLNLRSPHRAAPERAGGLPSWFTARRGTRAAPGSGCAARQLVFSRSPCPTTDGALVRSEDSSATTSAGSISTRTPRPCSEHMPCGCEGEPCGVSSGTTGCRRAPIRSDRRDRSVAWAISVRRPCAAPVRRP